MFEAELDSIRRLLEEVRAAVRLSAGCGLQAGDNEHVQNRGSEVKAVGEWCHQEGREVWPLLLLLLHGMHHSRAILLFCGVQMQHWTCIVRCVTICACNSLTRGQRGLCC